MKLLFTLICFTNILVGQINQDVCPGMKQPLSASKDEWYAQIRFDYDFDRDSVDVVLEGHPVGTYLMDTYEYTYYGFYIFKMENNMMCVYVRFKSKDKFYIANISGDGYLSLSLKLNNRPSYYRFDLSKGRYIYIHKNRKRRNRFVVEQVMNYRPYVEG